MAGRHQCQNSPSDDVEQITRHPPRPTESNLTERVMLHCGTVNKLFRGALGSGLTRGNILRLPVLTAPKPLPPIQGFTLTCPSLTRDQPLLPGLFLPA